MAILPQTTLDFNPRIKFFNEGVRQSNKVY